MLCKDDDLEISGLPIIAVAIKLSALCDENLLPVLVHL